MSKLKNSPKSEFFKVKLLKNKNSELSLISLLSMLFGTVLIASAAVMNYTGNFTADSDINETIETININLTLNQSPIATFPENHKNLLQIVEKNKHKLNKETEEYLKGMKDGAEERDYIIKFNGPIDEKKLANVSLEKKIESLNIIVISGKAEDMEGLIDDSKTQFVELEQNIKSLGDIVPSNILKIKADYAWNLSKGSGAKVAILDTGIGLHDDLAVAGFVSFAGSNYFDSNGHGTAVAGVIAALLNGKGLVGAAPEIGLYSVKVMDGSAGSLSNAISGLGWAIDNNMDIASMSFGFDSYSQIFKEVLEDAYSHNILLIAASGNNGQDNILYPAKYSTVIAVGAINESNSLASFSSYGFEQELVAPGVNINSTSLNNGYFISSGTSLAAPHVAGVAALIKAYNASLTNEQIRAKLRNDALDLGIAGKDDFYGYGLVQANLEKSDFNKSNFSYFYKVFNISHYGLPNISYTFWLNGTGKIDEVNFSVGYYLVNMTFNSGLKKSEIYNVSENGSIHVLSTTLILDDLFLTDGGSSTDGIGWLNEVMSARIDSTLSAIEAECFTVGSPMPSNTFDYCFFDGSSHKSECDSNDPDIICDSSHTQCSIVSSMQAPRQIIPYSFANSDSVNARAYGDCTFPGSSSQNAGAKSYFIVDRKAALCSNDSSYNISGWYGASWVVIASGTCLPGFKCVDTINFTSKSAYINPCIAQSTCTGTVQVIAEDSNGNPITGANVYRDGEFRGSTNEFGFVNFNLAKNCYQPLNYSVYCKNNATLCGSRTTALEKINDYGGLLFDCSICSASPDMQIDVDNVRANKASGQVIVNINLVGSFTATNVNITFKVQGNDGLISKEYSQLFNINSGDRFKFITQSISFAGNDQFVHVYVDSTSKLTESNERNNYVLVPLFQPEITAYLNITTGYPLVDQEIKDYLKLFVIEKPQSQAKVTIAVGLPNKNPIINSKNSFTKANYQWWFDNKINYDGAPFGKYPYNGLVGGFKDDYSYIFVVGNDIDGLLAAVKRLISARSLFFSNFNIQRTSVIGDLDVAGISVADLLRNPSNWPYYNQRNSELFANVVSRILNNNNFEISIKTVQTLNTTSYNQSTILRLKNVNTDFSENYKNSVVNGTKPVVMSGGTFSNLVTWEDDGKGLARDLVNDGHDVWEIEMNGGSNTECTACPDYTYQDQVDYYWPVLIAGVMNYSGKNQVNYVGHSNGCRVALSSLNSYSNGKNNAGYIFNTQTGLYETFVDLPNRPIDKFFGVACPAVVNGDSTFVDVAQANVIPFIGPKVGDVVMSKISNSHVTMFDFAWRAEALNVLDPFWISLQPEIVLMSSIFVGDAKISRNLLNYYKDVAINTSDSLSLSGVNVSELHLYHGKLIPLIKEHDFLVPFNDQQYILDNVNVPVENKTSIPFTQHSAIKNNRDVKKLIKEALRK